MRIDPRREPPRRELPSRDPRVRQAGRASPRRPTPRAPRALRCTASELDEATAPFRRWSSRTDGEDPSDAPDGDAADDGPVRRHLPQRGRPDWRGCGGSGRSRRGSSASAWSTSRRSYNLNLTDALETGHMLELAETIVVGAIRPDREPGRHSRTDYPKRDDATLDEAHARPTDAGGAEPLLRPGRLTRAGNRRSGCTDGAGRTISVPLRRLPVRPVAKDAKPRYQRYTLDLAPHTPVLTALLKIRAEVDPTLRLRYSCRSAICGSCAMQINSKSRLACETHVGPEVALHGRVVVEPMRNQPVVRDLVVDQAPFWTAVPTGWSRTSSSTRAKPMPEGRDRPDDPGAGRPVQGDAAMHRVRGVLLRMPGGRGGPGVPGADGAREALPVRGRPPRQRAPRTGSSGSRPRGSGSASGAICVPRPVPKDVRPVRADPRPQGDGDRGPGRAPSAARVTPSGSRTTSVRRGTLNEMQARSSDGRVSRRSSASSARASASGGRSRRS